MTQIRVLKAHVDAVGHDALAAHVRQLLLAPLLDGDASAVGDIQIHRRHRRRHEERHPGQHRGTSSRTHSQPDWAAVSAAQVKLHT